MVPETAEDDSPAAAVTIGVRCRHVLQGVRPAVAAAAATAAAAAAAATAADRSPGGVVANR